MESNQLMRQGHFHLPCSFSFFIPFFAKTRRARKHPSPGLCCCYDFSSCLHLYTLFLSGEGLFFGFAHTAKGILLFRVCTRPKTMKFCGALEDFRAVSLRLGSFTVNYDSVSFERTREGFFLCSQRLVSCRIAFSSFSSLFFLDFGPLLLEFGSLAEIHAMWA
jgi:hypothetical protein